MSMDLQTVVELPKALPPMAHGRKMLLMGSCFAENMGRLMAESKFDIDVNPFGILYNPLSIAAALTDIVSGRRYVEGDLFFYRDLWHSPMHHGDFSAPLPAEALERINGRIGQAHSVLPRLDWLMITFGTAYVYERRETGRVVANCHKLPDSCFLRRLLSPDEAVEVYASLLPTLFALAPDLKVLFTVSPVRHIRDGLHANQVSKATLLLAVDRLQRLFPERTFYFPSYEIQLDELRDYRFYADDMLHPSPLAVRYLWERFSDTFFSDETRAVVAEVGEITRGLAHRPFHPESEAYQRFLGQIVLKMERLNGKYPYLDFQKEKESCRIRLKP